MFDRNFDRAADQSPVMIMAQNVKCIDQALRRFKIVPFREERFARLWLNIVSS